MTRYRPQPSEVFADLPDTWNTGQMEYFIQMNEERLQEFALASV